MSVQILHQKLRAAFPAKWDSDCDRFAKDELKAMIEEFGSERTDRAVTHFIRSEQFFSIAKLREYVPPTTQVTSLYDKNCPDCDEGWRELGWEEIPAHIRNKMITLYGFEQARRETVVDRCHCWKGKTA